MKRAIKFLFTTFWFSKFGLIEINIKLETTDQTNHKNNISLFNINVNN